MEIPDRVPTFFVYGKGICCAKDTFFRALFTRNGLLHRRVGSFQQAALAFEVMSWRRARIDFARTTRLPGTLLARLNEKRAMAGSIFPEYGRSNARSIRRPGEVCPWPPRIVLEFAAFVRSKFRTC